MIEAVYHRKYNRLTVKGHAGSGEVGHDLPCCAASILAYTLAENVRELCERGLAIADEIKLEPGDAVIACTPRPAGKTVTPLVFQSVVRGFDILSVTHPHYVTFEVRE